MRKVYDNKGLTIGYPQVIAKGVAEFGWKDYCVYGKVSAGLPETLKTNKGTEYKRVLQIETYQSNAIVELAAISQDDSGNFIFAKTTNDKGKEVYIRNRTTGLNYYNIALTDEGEVVMFISDEAPVVEKQAFGDKF